MADKGKGRAKRRSGGEKRGARKRPSGKHLIRAISNSSRRRILETLIEHGDARSPAQIAGDFDLPVGPIVYHVTVLRNFGAVELVDEQKAGGGTEHFYTSTLDDDPPVEAWLDEAGAADEEDD